MGKKVTHYNLIVGMIVISFQLVSYGALLLAFVFLLVSIFSGTFVEGLPTIFAMFAVPVLALAIIRAFNAHDKKREKDE